MAKDDERYHDRDEENSCTTVAKPSQPSQSPTLLPSPIASAVSLVTRSSSLYLQLGSFIGGLALDGARVTTLTGLELSRVIIEGILNRAGRDVALRSTGTLGTAEAEGLLERSVATLHSTITAISFAASTGFYFSATALGSATDLSQQLLASLDSVLGSTDSSRAISSIVTLIRREFQNPATGQEGEKVGVSDLLIGICGLALLQRWCGKIAEVEEHKKSLEQVIWDVVVLNNGRRADVVGNSTAVMPSNSANYLNPVGKEVLETIERESQSREDSSDEDMPEIKLRQKIMQSLPEQASVSIRTEVTTTKTVTVDIRGAHPPDLTLPSGVEIVEENTHHPENLLGSAQGLGLVIPRYRVVYRITKNKLRGTSIKSEGLLMDGIEPEVIELSSFDDIPLTEASQDCTPTPSAGISAGFTNKASQSENSLPMPINNEDSLHPEPPTLSAQNPREIVANQKRSRQPTSTSSSTTDLEKPPAKKTTSKLPTVAKKSKTQIKGAEKKGTFRNALKKGSGTTLSGLWTKDSSPETSLTRSPPQKATWNAPTLASISKTQNPAPQRHPNPLPARDARRSTSNFFTSRDLGALKSLEVPRSPSTSYFSVHERRRDSMISHTDTYSIHSTESRPGSPTTFRTQLRAQSSLIRARSERNIPSPSASPVMNHRRSRSHVPSIYTLNTNPSSTSLVINTSHRASAFDSLDAFETFTRTGTIQGLFPQHHLVRNITRFIRFASASYGSSFLRVMGIVAPSTSSKREIDTKHHHEHHSFSNHTQLPPDTILLSSFVDPCGGTDSSGQTGTGVPMVHFVSLDHDSKAVVLTCRGTLGFEDVLTDLTCDFDALTYRGKEYSVHKGIHASARRLLDGGGGRVMATITAALEEFPDYGLVMCGHSLGGGVVALLAIMIAEPSPDPSSTAFVTSSTLPAPRLLTSSSSTNTSPPHLSRFHLPSGRPIHVYAYGPPATLSPSLRLATRGLITTIVNGQDLVPYLSLGVLHDLQAVALAFKNDDSGAKGEVRARVWEGLKGGFTDRWYNRSGQGVGGMGMKEDDQWAYSALKALRASMLSSKLVPPGEVFMVECSPVLKRDAFIQSDLGEERGNGLGRPATRSVLSYVRDVEKRFGEVRFGGSMLLDHSPGRYEASLGALGKGILS